MTKSTHFAEINGELLRLRREAKGWTLGDMATRACLSVKQVRQLEEGGASSFYSEAVKITTAKRVADLVGLSHQELFISPPEQVMSSEVDHVAVNASQNLAEVAELLQGANTSSVVDESEEEGRSKFWVIGLVIVVAVAALVLLHEPSAPVSAASSVSLPAQDNASALSAQAAASDASDAASQMMGATEAAVTASMPVAIASAPVMNASAAKAVASMAHPMASAPMQSGVTQHAATAAAPLRAASATTTNASVAATASHPASGASAAASHP